MSLNDSAYRIRLAGEHDRTYLARLLYLADVLGDETADVPGFHTDDVGLYVEDWSPLVDGGVIAFSDHNVPVGGAWLRYYTGQRKGAAYLGDAEARPHDNDAWATEFDPEEIPELFLAVEHRYRRLGAGRVLLRNACELAREQQAPGVSLLVDAANPNARALYESEGFVDVAVPGREPGRMFKRF